MIIPTDDQYPCERSTSEEKVDNLGLDLAVQNPQRGKVFGVLPKTSEPKTW